MHNQQDVGASAKRGLVGSIAHGFHSIVRALIALAAIAIVAVAAVVGMGIFTVHQGLSTVSQVADIGGRAESTTQSEIANQAPSMTIAATALYADYNSNEVAADQKFKGKTLLVKGTIEDIGKDLLNTMYVTLAGNGMLANVQCFFGPAHETQIAGLRKGMTVSIVGRCDGKMMNVLMRGCTLKN